MLDQWERVSLLCSFVIGQCLIAMTSCLYIRIPSLSVTDPHFIPGTEWQIWSSNFNFIYSCASLFLDTVLKKTFFVVEFIEKVNWRWRQVFWSPWLLRHLDNLYPKVRVRMQSLTLHVRVIVIPTSIQSVGDANI